MVELFCGPKRAMAKEQLLGVGGDDFVISLREYLVRGVLKS